MRETIYSLIALLSTFVGSLTGMGGGIIMKPLIDLLGDYGSEGASMLSSCAVLAMSLVNVARRVIGAAAKKRKEGAGEADAQREPEQSEVPASRLITLALGSTVGGYAGQVIFDALSGSSSSVKQVQNAVMAALVLVIFFYMLFSARLPRFHFKAVAVYALVGVALGVISSFLGIGGGPVNVAVLTLMFSMDIKTAVFASLLSVLFTQTTKLLTVLITKGVSPFMQEMMPFMIAGAVIGGFAGALVVKKLSKKTVRIIFCALQVVVFAVCIINIFR